MILIVQSIRIPAGVISLFKEMCDAISCVGVFCHETSRDAAASNAISLCCAVSIIPGFGSNATLTLTRLLDWCLGRLLCLDIYIFFSVRAHLIWKFA